MDALKTFQSEGWTELELATLTKVAACHRQLGEKEKLARTLVQVAALLGKETGGESEKEKRVKAEAAFEEVKQLIKEMGKKVFMLGIR